MSEIGKKFGYEEIEKEIKVETDNHLVTITKDGKVSINEKTDEGTAILTTLEKIIQDFKL
jgi:ArsR family metal-binding transcriptional regulator